jgi:hypothetical protein
VGGRWGRSWPVRRKSGADGGVQGGQRLGAEGKYRAVPSCGGRRGRAVSNTQRVQSP